MAEKKAKERLIELYEDVWGSKVEVEMSEISLIVDILEILADRSKEQDGHTHSIS